MYKVSHQAAMSTSMHAKQRSSDYNAHRVASFFVLDAIPSLYPYIADCCLLLYQCSKYHILLLKLMSCICTISGRSAILGRTQPVVQLSVTQLETHFGP